MFITRLNLLEQASSLEWELGQDLIYEGIIDRFVAPKGFTTDLASVPRIFRSLIPSHGLYSKAAVIHDYLYVYKHVSRKDADGIFRRIMREEGVSKWKRWTMYYAVRIGGYFYWKE